MKFSCPFYLMMILGALTSCQSNYRGSDEVVCETVHRYGVPLEPEDWSSRGQYGQVVSMRKDGVTATRSYEAGILQGECTYTFPHSKTIQKKEMYDHGEMTQEYSYYPNSLPWQQVDYAPANRQSIITWYECGAPQYREDREEGRLINGEYYTLDQQVESRVENANGLRMNRDGMGQLQSVDKIENGQMILSTVYHPNGMPAAITPYVNGVIEGYRHTYFPGGDPATIEQWTNNTQEGNTTVFEYGEKRADVPYVNGYKHGVEKRYHDEQVLAQEVNWKNGQQHGPCYSYIGNSTQSDWYFRDQKVPNKATYEMLCSQ